MNLPGVEVAPPNNYGLETGKIQQSDSSQKLDKLQLIGYKILLLGMTPEKFLGKFSVHHALLFLTLIFFHTMYGSYEGIITVFFSRSMLEQVSHGYITTYLYAFNMQWYSMLMNMRSFHTNPIHIENFHCTQAYPEIAERLLNKNANSFFIVMFLSASWWTTNSMTHIIGPAVEAIISLVMNGKVQDLFILPQVFQTPWWAQILIYFANAVTMFGLLLYCVASYTIMGTQALKISTLCEILNEALKNNNGESSKIKFYIVDHIEIIKRTKELNSQLATLNGFMFTACYLEFAIQMFALTLFEPSGAYYFAVAFDLLSIFLILTFQCWMGSLLTHSLESISHGVYESEWYERDKDNALNVLIMSQMAQKSFVQTIWMGSLKVERATTFSLVRSSYTVYTVLMILQKK